MIDPKELRIGNAVLFDGATGIVSQLRSDGAFLEPDNYSTYLRLSPISLSPEILEKCGFVKPEGYTNDYRRIVIGKSLLSLERATTREGHYRVWYDCEFCMFIKMEYLHQLQNLTFALTAQELTPNL